MAESKTNHKVFVAFCVAIANRFQHKLETLSKQLYSFSLAQPTRAQADKRYLKNDSRKIRVAFLMSLQQIQ